MADAISSAQYVKCIRSHPDLDASVMNCNDREQRSGNEGWLEEEIWDQPTSLASMRRHGGEGWLGAARHRPEHPRVVVRVRVRVCVRARAVEWGWAEGRCERVRGVSVCVCVCVCARVRVCMRVRACVRVRVGR